MFRFLATIIVRVWPLFLLFWGGVLAAVYVYAPPWAEVGNSGQTSYLNAAAPSQVAQVVFNRAFPGRQAGSDVILVLSRTDGNKLQSTDLSYVNDTLVPRLQALLFPPDHPASESDVAQIRGPGDGPTGTLLKSNDDKAVLVVIELRPPFSDSRNWPTVSAIEKFLHDLRRDGWPHDLAVALSGSVVLARDIGVAEARSAKDVQSWTIYVVIGLLVIVYRAPVLALIPLATVFVAIEVAVRLLSLLSGAGHLNLYQGVRVYATVVGYGAGVDYCLFLIARCQEEWAATPDRRAVRAAIEKVGPAIAASAATVVIGIAMMGFANYRNISQAGLAIAFSLTVVFSAALTLAPAMLCLTGPLAVWPHRIRGHDPVAARTEQLWQRVGRHLIRRPAAIGLLTVAAMAPFAVIGGLRLGHASYDLTRDLPADTPSAIGLKALRAHFPAGATGPVVVLLDDDRIDFRSPRGVEAVRQLVARLEAERTELALAGVRSVATPLGTSMREEHVLAGLPAYAQDIVRQRAVDYYVGGVGGHVTQLELILDRDPFSKEGLQALGEVERILGIDLPPELRGNCRVMYMGAAAGLRDLQAVTVQDRTRVDLLAIGAIFLVLLVLLRQPVLSAYLILTVVFGYLTTLGVAYLVFEALERKPFPGLDWRVPFFLFTILIAVGEDYNIFLLTRVREEVARLGPKEGLVEAVGKTGGTITACGAIMAGTFASLIAGSLVEMWQMGFALSFGVLLDTAIIRPVLVPIFLLYVECWRRDSQACKETTGRTAQLTEKSGEKQ